MTRASKYVAPASGIQFEPQSGVRESLGGSELGNLESVACGSPPRRAYPPQWSCGREAEGGGLLNRYRVVKPYRGFESLRLRHPASRCALRRIGRFPRAKQDALRSLGEGGPFRVVRLFAGKRYCCRSALHRRNG